MMESLQSILSTRALLRDVQVTLASGTKSGVYVDCKRVTLHGPSLAVVARAMTERLAEQRPRPTQVAGVSVGGDPLVAAVILAAAAENWELEGLLVRKEAKSHGISQGRAVDGAAPRSGASVWLLEDVITTGNSSLTAAEHLKREGYALKGILCMVDREVGGVQRLADALKVPVLSLTTLSQLQ